MLLEIFKNKADDLERNELGEELGDQSRASKSVASDDPLIGRRASGHQKEVWQHSDSRSTEEFHQLFLSIVYLFTLLFKRFFYVHYDYYCCCYYYYDYYCP